MRDFNVFKFILSETNAEQVGEAAKSGNWLRSFLSWLVGLLKRG